VRYGCLKITRCSDLNIKIGKQAAHGIMATHGIMPHGTMPL
jgi:hypothetical protein